MAFETEGFLSKELDNWKTENRSSHSQGFALLEQINVEVMAVMVGRDLDHNGIVASTLLARATQSYQAAILLLERGMEADARTLIRSCIESAIAMGGLAFDDKFLDSLTDSHAAKRVRLAREVLEKNLLVGATAEQIEEIKQYASENITRKRVNINWRDVAERVGMEDLYDEMYKEMSNDGTHVSFDSLYRHIEKSSGIGINFEPKLKNFERTTIAAIAGIGHCIIKFGEVIADEEVTDRGYKIIIVLSEWILKLSPKQLAVNGNS